VREVFGPISFGFFGIHPLVFALLKASTIFKLHLQPQERHGKKGKYRLLAFLLLSFFLLVGCI